MRDSNNVQIKVGQTVYFKHSIIGLEHAEVIGFTAQKVRIKHWEGNILTFPENLVVEENVKDAEAFVDKFKNII